MHWPLDLLLQQLSAALQGFGHIWKESPLKSSSLEHVSVTALLMVVYRAPGSQQGHRSGRCLFFSIYFSLLHVAPLGASTREVFKSM